jgi:hypothetical protein
MASSRPSVPSMPSRSRVGAGPGRASGLHVSRYVSASGRLPLFLFGWHMPDCTDLHWHARLESGV